MCQPLLKQTYKVIYGDKLNDIMKIPCEEGDAGIGVPQLFCKDLKVGGNLVDHPTQLVFIWIFIC